MKKIRKDEKDFIEKNRRFTNHKQSFPWKAAVKNPSLLALVLAFYCCQWGNYFFIAWLPVYLQEGRHFSENEMKMTTSYLFIVGIIGALTGGVVSDWLVKKKGVRFSRRFIAMLSLSMVGGLILLTAMTKSNTIVVAGLIIAHYLYLPGIITSFSTCVDIGGDNAGTVAGIMNCFGQLGAFFMAVIFGKIVDATHSFTTPLYILSSILFAGCLLWLAVDAGKPLQIEAEGYLKLNSAEL